MEASKAMDLDQPGSSAETLARDNLMWIEKYRPQSLNDLLSHKQIVNTLEMLISSNRLPHLLFCGPPGTGKTSTILACARKMYGPSFKSMVLELNASDDRGITVVRDQIKNFASTRRIFSSGVKLIILDEADAMTSAAQMALRRVVEKFAANTRFCIICNYVNRIIPALQSRCTKFRFGPLPSADVFDRLEQIAKSENVSLTKDGLEALVTVGKGDMRRILNIMQSCHMACKASGTDAINADTVYSNTGAPHPKDIAAVWSWLQSADFNVCIVKLRTLKMSKGLALHDIVLQLLDHVRGAKWDQSSKLFAYEQLALIEHRLSIGGSEKINLLALVACCKMAAATSPDLMDS